MEYADKTHSKELKDLFPNAKRWWFEQRVSSEEIEWKLFDKTAYSKETLPKYYLSRIPALTTDMLLEILPSPQRINGRPCVLEIVKGVAYTVRYYHPHEYHEESDKSLPNALCKTLKYLRDNGLLKEE